MGEVRSPLPDGIPVLALTATATPSTKKKIMHSLAMQSCFEVVISPNRKNIRLHVQKGSADIEENFSCLLDMVKENNITCPRILVYTQSVPVCSAIFTFLMRRLKNLAFWPHDARQISRNRMVAMYHAGTDQTIQKTVLDSLGKPDGIVRVVLATSALSMGVDFKELHLVVHYGPPSDVESYVQQLGRAGRDGVQSDGV